jgi:hypothetical protein
VRDPQGQQGALIPVRVGECHPGGILSAMIHVNLIGLAELDARYALLEALEERAKPVQALAFPRAERPTAAPVSFPGIFRRDDTHESPQEPLLRYPTMRRRGDRSTTT